MPSTRVRPRARLTAPALGTYPSSSITWRSRAAVAGSSSPFPLSTRETVVLLTPARAATSAMVMGTGQSPPHVVVRRKYRCVPAETAALADSGRPRNRFRNRFRGMYRTVWRRSRQESKYYGQVTECDHGNLPRGLTAPGAGREPSLGESALQRAERGRHATCADR